MTGKIIRVTGFMFAFAFIGFLVGAEDAIARPPFKRGVNLTGWFDVASPGQIQFQRFTKKNFAEIKSLGADVIRLPINLHAMTDGAPDYTLDPLFLGFLDQAVDWAEELGLYIILDNHTFDPARPTDANIDRALLKVWPQMARHFQGRSDRVLYEVLNEPHGIDLGRWAKIQGKVIDAIRAVDARHTIVVGTADFNNYRDLEKLPKYADKNLIYTFHFYDPFLFTHQGAEWTTPSLVDLSGVPYPPADRPIPPTPESLMGTWAEDALRIYRVDGSLDRVKELIDIAANFSAKRGVPVFCGEFGVYITQAKNDDRAAWYRDVRTYLEEKGIPWTSWDYMGGFGLFTTVNGRRFESDLNVPVVKALGFTAPAQKSGARKAERAALDIYRDYAGDGIVTGGYLQKGHIDFYSKDNPASGQYALRWGGCERYGAISFYFAEPRDFSVLLSEGYAIELMARAAGTGTKFEVRFRNPYEEVNAKPWRMSYTVEVSEIPADNTWHRVRIPLSDMRETGAWKNAWFQPEGKFSWKEIACFEIVAEHLPLSKSEYTFDDIRIVK